MKYERNSARVYPLEEATDKRSRGFAHSEKIIAGVKAARERKAPPAEPKCDCGTDNRQHFADCASIGYRPPTPEPAERCLIHDEPLDEKGFCPRRRIDKDAIQAEIVTAPPDATEDARVECPNCGAWTDSATADAWLFLHNAVHAEPWGVRFGLSKVPFALMSAIAEVMEQYAAKRLAAERERIVDEFIADVEAEVDEVEFWRVRDIEEVQRILQAVKARGGVISAGK